MLMPSLFRALRAAPDDRPHLRRLPVAHDTGGIHDTIAHLDATAKTGNGFVFEVYDAGGLCWAIEEAMRFYNLPVDERRRHDHADDDFGGETFNHAVTARHYIDLYEKMLARPLIVQPPV